MESLRAALRRRAGGARAAGGAGRRSGDRQNPHRRRAGRRGARRAAPRCWSAAATRAAAAPPFWPWVQIVRAYSGAHARPPRWRASSDAMPAQIAQLMPERARGATRPAGPGAAGAGARPLSSLRRLRRVLEAHCAPTRHWSSCSTICTGPTRPRCACSIRGARARRHPLLVVVTYREVDLQDDHPLTPCSASWRVSRQPAPPLAGPRARRTWPASSPCVTGADPGAVAGRRAARDHRWQSVLRYRGGAALASEGRLAQRDDTRRARHRVSRSASARRSRTVWRRSRQPCLRVLTVASVIGREFDLLLLQTRAPVEPPAAASAALSWPALDEAAAARFIDADDAPVGRYSFCHALIRQTLYESLSPAQRVRLHQHIGAPARAAAQRRSLRLGCSAGRALLPGGARRRRGQGDRLRRARRRTGDGGAGVRGSGEPLPARAAGPRAASLTRADAARCCWSSARRNARRPIRSGQGDPRGGREPGAGTLGSGGRRGDRRRCWPAPGSASPPGSPASRRPVASPIPSSSTSSRRRGARSVMRTARCAPESSAVLRSSSTGRPSPSGARRSASRQWRWRAAPVTAPHWRTR